MVKKEAEPTQMPRERTFLVGVEIRGQESLLSLDDSLNELELLAKTAGLNVVGSSVQKMVSPNVQTFIGSGKVEEVQALIAELGAEVVKIFPGSTVGGPAFVKAVLGPMPWTSIMPTGGVSPDEENLKEWFDAGVTCVGMGSQLFPKEILDKENFEYITQKCADSILIIKNIRNK